MSEALDTIIEEDAHNDNEEAPEKVEETKPEESKAEAPEETPKEAEPKQDEQFKNKTDRMKHKKVKCEGCQAEMTLKTLRYSHKCSGKTEDKPIKPKPKARTVAVKPIENQVIKTIPPTRMKEPKQEEMPLEKQRKTKVVMKPPEPPRRALQDNDEQPRQLTAREILEASYAEIRRAKREAHIEKINGFKSKMF